MPEAIVDLQTKPLPEVLMTVCQCINNAGGRAWMVGGSVRDMLLGLLPKDFDLEVYGLDTGQLKEAIQPLGRYEEVGRLFGVIKLWTGDMEIDLALPRSESKQGRGHRGFHVTSDPHMEPQAASARRDFTINAIMLDPVRGELLDFHHGREDLKHGILRHVSAAFAEDPLRPLRAMQFAARFRLRLNHETARLCRTLLGEADTLPVARIWEEWRKWAHAPYPSFGLRVLEQSGWMACYPQLARLVSCVQDPAWHPEGDVWTHTGLVVDCAAAIATRYAWSGSQREILMFSALCHDLGKPPTTFTHDNGRIRSTGHCKEGIEPSKGFLRAIGAPQSLIQHILSLVHEHLAHMHGDATPRSVRRLAHRLQPAGIEMWEALVEADASGRAPLPASRPALPWLQQARNMSIHEAAPKPIAHGAMLKELGIPPGPVMGEILDAAYQAQLDGKITDAGSARRWLSRRLASH